MSKQEGQKEHDQPSSGGMVGRPGGFNRPHGMMMTPVAKAHNSRETLLRLWGYLSKEKLGLAGVFTMVIISCFLNLLGPLLIGIAIDRYIIPGDFGGLLYISLLMVAVYVASATITWLQNYWMIGIAQKTVFQIRKQLFEQVQNLPLGFFDSRPHGELMSRLTNDIENISNSLNTSATQVFASFITLLGIVGVMLWLSPLLTVVSLVTIPLMILGTKAIAGRTRLFFSEQQKHLGTLNGLIEETISGQRVVKVFGQENKIMKQFEENNHCLRRSGVRAQIFSGFIPPLMNVLNNVGFALIAAVGGWLAVKQVISVGVIVIFVNYSKQFMRPLAELANQFNMIQSAIAGAERAFEVIDEEPELEDPIGTLPLTNVQGEVVFHNVSFAYKKETPVLRNINLRVSPGQTVAFVGPTGAGKTTIINLLTRFYDVDEGKITVDGQDIRTIQRKSLRSSLGIVLQDTYLFSESVRDNIRYGRPDATDPEVEAAARLANAHSFIQRLPQGYDTVLSEDGGNISHGQKQLLAIARTILADPAILILDEATSSVDTRTEVQIQQGMLRLMEGRTSFVIAHRLRTIRDADQIVVINRGQIVEEGNHDTLLRKKGFYYDLYMNQFKEDMP